MINPRKAPSILLLLFLLLSGGSQLGASTDLLGQALPGSEDTAPNTDPTSPAQIALRTEELAAERAQLAAQIQQQPQDADAAALVASTEERLAQINLLLKAQLDLAELLALQPELATEPHDDEPSIYQLNLLYEPPASTESAVRDRRSRLDAAQEC